MAEGGNRLVESNDCGGRSNEGTTAMLRCGQGGT